MAAGLPLPKQIWAHGWLLMDSAKMSKSLGNVVRPRPIVHVLGMDALRYYLLRETVFGQDGNFSYDALVQRYNSDLANGLGNLASRTAAMIEKYFDGRIPNAIPGDDVRYDTLLHTALADISDVCNYYDVFNFSRALERIWNLISEVDKYLVLQQPWTLAEDPPQREKLARILYGAAETLRIVSALAHPFIPESTQKIWTLLGYKTNLTLLSLDELTWGQLKPGTPIGKIEAVFPRIDKAEAIERMESMEKEAQKQPSPVTAPAPATAPAPGGAAAAAAPQAAPEKIGIEDFSKVEMRVGQIKTAERIVGADKLLKLTVDIGTEIRQICAGIAQYYEPEKLIGRKVAVVVNLAPRKLRGVESNGMVIAAAVGPEGRPVLAGFPDEDVEIGSRLK